MAEHEDTIPLRLRLADRVLGALHVAGEDLLGKAQRLAPKDEGTLRGSATLVMIVNGTRHEGEGSLETARQHVHELIRARVGWRADVEISFNTVYAARQHEEVDWHHKVGQAKYLEEPFRDNVGRYEALISAAASI